MKKRLGKMEKNQIEIAKHVKDVKNLLEQQQREHFEVENTPYLVISPCM